MTSPLIDPILLTQAQIRCPSVTPADAGALETLATPLRQMGFAITNLRFEESGTAPIENIFAKIGNTGRHLCYMGHTDVVPTGDVSNWTHPPFAAVIENGNLYGRGAVDMKGGNAAFVAALSRFLNKHPDFSESISLLLTGDEEAVSINGTVKVIDWMLTNNQMPDVALVGEPSNPSTMGEGMRVGRRGSLNGKLVVKGVQGHSAYPERADNPVAHLTRLINRLLDEKLDEGTADFPPSHFVISSIDVGNPAPNIIPGKAEALFNIRFNDAWTAKTLETHIRSILDSVHSGYELTLWCNAESFVTPDSPWRRLVSDAIKKVSGKIPKADTGGGTSDARFIARYCPVVEYGLVNTTIHKVDEHTPIGHIEDLTATYLEILEQYFS